MLAVYLVAVALRSTAPFRRATPIRGPHWRLSNYWATIKWQWAFVAVLLLAMPLGSILGLAEPETANWRAYPQLVFVVVGNIVGGMYGPIVLAWSHLGFRRRFLAPFAPVQALLPITLTERLMWVGVSLTTGICEELMFRGFALEYLMQQPFSLSFGGSALITSVLFGLGHAYQGRRGVLRTMLFGAALCGLLLLTGSLLFPIVVHTLVNLRIALMPASKRPTPALAR